ncbi:FAD-dependent oxidoreductase [Microcella alkalica]|uniref:Monoamine oxidase n=1 Tax=Microcella alkalica TaxID=355930 RepID=A0A839E6P2_9MICO|nr:monoamine oxidase [Microcella alkalica]
MTRRTFLIGATGLTAAVLAACSDERPQPSPEPTPAPPVGAPRPSGVARSDWLGDSFSRGSSSYLPVGESPRLREDLAAPWRDRLFFAGEATSTDAPSTVHGALASGERAAAEILGVAAPGERVVIVGAGIAGAAAARLLVDDGPEGLEVIVLEARGRTGGRIHTIESGAWPGPVELGAQWVRSIADHDLLERLVRVGVEIAIADAALALDDEGATRPIPPAGQPPSLEAALLPVIARARAAAETVEPDVALATALALLRPWSEDPGPDGGPSERQTIALALAALVEPRLGAASGVLSAGPGLDELALGAENLVTGGWARLVDALLDDVDVQLSSPVTGVAVGEDSVSVRLGVGDSFSADRVVLTAPLGVLQQGGIDLELPAVKDSAIARLGVGAIETIWLRYAEPFWDEEAALWVLADPEAAVPLWLNLQAVTGEPVIVGVVAGARAIGFGALGEEDAVTAALAGLAPLVGAREPSGD